MLLRSAETHEVAPATDSSGASAGRWPAGARLLTPLMLASAPLLLIEPEMMPWALAGALGLIATGTVVRRSPRIPQVDAIQRHMMWCRRRGEPANVLVIAIEPGTPRSSSALLAATRATDTFVVHRSMRGVEVHGLLDGGELDRMAVERRLAERLGPNAACAFGWAVFPDDGFTLDVLLDVARSSLSRLPTPPRRGPVPLARLRR
jgi:hypothetical protein